MKVEQDELKRLAHLARRRLASGYFDAESQVQQQKQRQSYTNFVQQQLKKDVVQDERALQFVERVRTIVNAGHEIVNPIGQLIDRDYYEKLDYAAQQRYILELSEKYRQVAATILKKS